MHQQAQKNLTEQANKTCEQRCVWLSIHSCKTCLITHTFMKQWKSCQNWMADVHFCRCQCIPGAHYRNCDKWQWKSNSRCECMTLLYHYHNNVLLWGIMLKKSEAFFVNTGTVFTLFSGRTVTSRLSHGITLTSLSGVTPPTGRLASRWW